MVDQTRRRLLKASALLPLAAACGGRVWASAPSDTVEANFRPDTQHPGHCVDASLASLSYETLELANPAFFSAGNHGLVRLFRELNPQGILRIGGNTSDWTTWSDYHGKLLAEHHTRGGTPRRSFQLHPQSLHELAGFLDATGWKLIFGVNLKIGIPAMGAELAKAVQRIVGKRLLAIQIGNEANNYKPSYAAYDAAWTPYAKLIEAEHVPLAGPDTGANTDWVEAYAREHGSVSVFLSRHYYRGGASHGSIHDMLSGDPGFYKQAAEIVHTGDAMGLPFRLTEANSYWSGGRNGVSNVFASALWGGDFMLALAQSGVAGIHFHGGTLKAVEASLGHAAATSSRGDLTTRRDAVSARYSPIAGDVALGFQPRPLYHGMLLAQHFAGTHMLPGQLDAAGANLTAYAARQQHGMLVALFNKDAKVDATVTIHHLPAGGTGQLKRLRAPALDSPRDVVFANAGSVTIDARGRCRIVVPRASAVLAKFGT